MPGIALPRRAAVKDEAGRASEPTQRRTRWVPPKKLRYYHILGLEPGVSLEELKQTHRDLVKVWHPDRFADDPRLEKKAQEKLKEINEAYAEVLLDVLPATALPDPFSAPEPHARPYPAAIHVEASETPPVGFESPLPSSKRRLAPYFSLWAAAALGLLAIAAVIAIGVGLNDDSQRTSTAESTPDEATAVEEPASDAPAFTLGSTKDEVLGVQGTPTSVEGNRWMYELSSVDFSDGRVDSYANVSRNLHVRLDPAHAALAVRSRGYFTLGSDPDEVLAVQGTPTSVQGRRWRYESSAVDFLDRKVESYDNASRNLHVRINPAGDTAAARARGYFTLGSSPDEVLAVQGTPTSIEGTRWTYDNSAVGFSDGQLDRYVNGAQNLHIQVFPKGDSSLARAHGVFTLGSSQDDVLAVQGTPSSIEGSRWTYELSWVKFDQGKVESYSNLSGNLRLRVR
jgi:DnaJ-like protein